MRDFHRMKKKPKILVVLGPTASGKSDLAVSLAKKLSGEVISADSRQVYTGLNIGSGKITKREMRGIPHYLLDVKDPKKIFTVSNFKQLAEKAIKEILKKGKLPIVCGGTGFYIDALVKNITLPEVPPNSKLRKSLEKFSTEELFQKLKKLDTRRAKEIDSKNRVRLVRAIEIAEALGNIPKAKETTPFDTTYIGILWNDEDLRARINQRLQKRLKQGMIKEVTNLHNKGLSWKRLEDLGLEYRYIAEYLQKKITREEMIALLQNKIWQYAKRQMTWFKRNKKIVWVSGGELSVAVKKLRV